MQYRAASPGTPEKPLDGLFIRDALQLRRPRRIAASNEVVQSGQSR
jgi:hypothetical protein